MIILDSINAAVNATAPDTRPPEWYQGFLDFIRAIYSAVLLAIYEPIFGPYNPLNFN